MTKLSFIRRFLNNRTPSAHDGSDSERIMQALALLQKMEFTICTVALQKLQSADLSDKNVLIRAIMSDLPDFGISSKLSIEDYAVDMWVDRAEYVDDKSFNLYLTKAEQNVFWNIKEKGRKPGRMDGPQQRITVRQDMLWNAPFIPLAYLFVLSSKLLAMAALPETELSEYIDEKMMMAMDSEFCSALEKLTNGSADKDMSQPH